MSKVNEKVNNGLMSGKVNIEKTKKLSEEELRKFIKKCKDRDSEKVTGIFKNYEAPGGSLRFNIRLYDGDEIDTYELFDGERYTLPRGVVRHLNNECWYPEYKHLPGQQGEQGIRAGNPDGKFHVQQNMMATKKVHRFAFHSMDFMDDDYDLKQADIIQVTAV